MEKYDLSEPSDDIQQVLKRIAVKLGKTQRVKALTGVGKTSRTSVHHCSVCILFLLITTKNDKHGVLSCPLTKHWWTDLVCVLYSSGNITITIPNYTAAAYDFIRTFRKGELGRVRLD